MRKFNKIVYLRMNILIDHNELLHNSKRAIISCPIVQCLTLSSPFCCETYCLLNSYILSSRMNKSIEINASPHAIERTNGSYLSDEQQVPKSSFRGMRCEIASFPSHLAIVLFSPPSSYKKLIPYWTG